MTMCPLNPKWLRKQYEITMHGTIDEKYKFLIPETGFNMQFNNTVVYFRITLVGGYDRAIQYQCKMENDVRVFTGINFLSRDHFNSDNERQRAVDEMKTEAEKVGIEQEYLDQLKIVGWQTC
ncbi:unnamed protein product [Didymodactylos carnosus]|uniref:Uncharacterized protein n=1 Tax=Didymodactylos carnosus TaxID=1234261 RepID=A0A814XIQ2_9BILA|nr:unnamed protein product [Didymodactylos carnosus]CAF1217199.1 unnamed protein product [Didymodactylos carnosus]CAF3667454.1 unnamed protein product [Didymodactylos carnosus]CAF3980904.1 unnamed protein product [Didymodactylos carnosus]